jgi:hypothetical protein
MGSRCSCLHKIIPYVIVRDIFEKCYELEDASFDISCMPCVQSNMFIISKLKIHE